MGVACRRPTSSVSSAKIMSKWEVYTQKTYNNTKYTKLINLAEN